MGVTSLESLGLATAIPPTALVTDTAGVKIPSASVRLVPKRLYGYGIGQNANDELRPRTITSSGHHSF